MLFCKNVIQKVKIEGMMCEHCAMRVKAILEELDGAKCVKVTLKDGLAEIKSKEGISEEVLKNTIEKAGYKFLGLK